MYMDVLERAMEKVLRSGDIDEYERSIRAYYAREGEAYARMQGAAYRRTLEQQLRLEGVKKCKRVRNAA